MKDKLPKEGLNESNEKYLNYVEKRAIRLHQLITDLLDYTGLEKSEIEKSPVHVEDVINEVKVALHNLIAKHNAEILLLHSEIPPITCNRERLLLLFQNLISNVIKFRHPDRDPVIKINYQSKAKHHHFSVADNGMGIKEENQEMVFEIFKRLLNKDKVEGTGIGLSICRRIIEQHSGKISLSSTYGEGSTFHFTLEK